MKNKRIKIGSQVFFSEYEDYTSHDRDFIEFQEKPELYKTFMNVKGKGNDIFYYRMMSKDEFIKYELEHCKATPMAAGKFLVPELAEYIGFTIEDLKLFQFAFDNIDEKHKYEQIIYKSYIENNCFILSEEQRIEAYKLYINNKKKN